MKISITLSSIFIALMASASATASSIDKIHEQGSAASSILPKANEQAEYIQLAQAVTFRNVTKVWYRGDTFEKTGGNRWVEKSRDGVFNYVEVDRQSSAVFLRDLQRNVVIFLAVHNRTVGISENGSPQRPLYKMTKVHAGGSAAAPSTQTQHHCHNRVQRHRHSGFGKTTHSHYQKNCEINIQGGQTNQGDSNENCIKIGPVRVCN